MDEGHSLGNARAWVRRQASLSARQPAAHGLETCLLSNVGRSTPPDKIEWESHEAGRPIPRFAALRPRKGTGLAGGSVLARPRQLPTVWARYSRVLEEDGCGEG